MFNNKKILLLTPKRLGDTLMLTPAIHYLKSCYPSLEMDVLAFSEVSRGVLNNNPDIQTIFLLSNKPNLDSYDFILNIYTPRLSQLLGETQTPIFTCPEPDGTRHQADCALDYVKSLCGSDVEYTKARYRLFPLGEDREYIQRLLVEKNLNVREHILIALQLGCHSIAKKRLPFFRKKLSHPKIWPYEHFVKLGKLLSDYDSRIRLVLTGSNNEKVLGARFLKEVPNAVSFIDETSVLQLKALLEKMHVMVTSDTGVMHVACSVGMPMAVLSGHTNMVQTGPYPYPGLENCTILAGETLSALSVETVFKTVIQKI